MATKAKESTVVGKEKKAPSSNSHITSTIRTTKPSTTTTSSTNKATSTPSEENIPNYLKPTISSRLESPSFKQPKSDAPNKPNLNRRRSFDRPLSSSNLTKQKQPSPSRLHKALVSPGPRERTIPHRSSTVPVKSTNPSKPISDRTSKTPRDGKTQPLLSKSAKKSTPRLSTSTSTKKLANDHASANSTNAAKSTAETVEASNVASEEVKEVTNQEVEVIKVKNEENQVEHVSEISPHVDSEHDEHDHGLEESESDQPHNQADNEKVISTVSEEEAKKEPQEEKTKDEHEEEEYTNQDESNNDGSHPEEHSAAEEGEVAVNEKEDEGGVIIEDHKSENNNEEEAVVEENEAVDGGTSEGVEEAKAEPTQPKQQLAAGEQRKKESQVSNDVIEETASKLLEARKNKVRALAGAFQTVIDYQTTSK